MCPSLVLISMDKFQHLVILHNNINVIVWKNWMAKKHSEPSVHHCLTAGLSLWGSSATTLRGIWHWQCHEHSRRRWLPWNNGVHLRGGECGFCCHMTWRLKSLLNFFFQIVSSSPFTRPLVGGKGKKSKANKGKITVSKAILLSL